MDLKILLFLVATLILATIPASSAILYMPPDETKGIGYEYLDNGDVLHFWNQYNDYYLNTSSGIQFSNYYNDYWTHNIFCLGYKPLTTWNYMCTDTLPIQMNPMSDNSTYVNITGSRDVTVSGRNIRITLEYYLDEDASELKVKPILQNLDFATISTELGFAWKTNDIRIGGDYEYDTIYVNGTLHDASDTLDLFFTQSTLNETFGKKYTYYDRTGAWLHLRWTASNYFLKVKSEAGEYNAPSTVAVTTPGLGMYETKSTDFYWQDPMVTENATTGEGWWNIPNEFNVQPLAAADNLDDQFFNLSNGNCPGLYCAKLKDSGGSETDTGVGYFWRGGFLEGTYSIVSFTDLRQGSSHEYKANISVGTDIDCSGTLSYFDVGNNDGTSSWYTNSSTFRYQMGPGSADTDGVGIPVCVNSTGIFDIVILGNGTASGAGVDINLGAMNISNYTEVVSADLTAPTLGDFKATPLDSNKAVIGDQTGFNTSQLEEIEFMEINFTVSDATGSLGSNMTIYYAANGTGGCAPGNKGIECHNVTLNNFIRYMNGTNDLEYDDSTTGSARGDAFTCTFTGPDTLRNWSCIIDEHYNPNIFKHYDALYDFSDTKWQNATNQQITGNKYISIDLSAKINPTTGSDIIPLDADQYKLDFRVNYSITPPLGALEAYICNTSYTTGDPEVISGCQLVATRTPAELQDDGTKFRAILTKDFFTGLNNIKHLILKSDIVNPNRWYSIKTYAIQNGSYSQRWRYSLNAGSSWNGLGDGYESEANMNWFYDGAEPTNIVFRVEMNDTENNTANSSDQTVLWEIDASQDYPPVVTINEPDNDNRSANNITVVWSYFEPNGDATETNITVDNGTETVIELEILNVTTQWPFDTRLLQDGDYNLTVTVYENATTERLFGNDTHNISIDNTPPDLIDFVSPTLANGSNATDSYFDINVTFSETNTVTTCLIELENATKVNYTGTITGNEYCFFNATGQPVGLHNYSVWIGDDLENQNVSRLNWVNVLTQDLVDPDQVVYVSPTLDNGSTITVNYFEINISFLEENPVNCQLQMRNTTGLANYSIPAVSGADNFTYCYGNFTNGNELLNFTMFAVDTANNQNASVNANGSTLHWINVSQPVPSILVGFACNQTIANTLQCGGKDANFLLNCTTNSQGDYVWSNENATFCRFGCFNATCLSSPGTCINYCNPDSGQRICGGFQSSFQLECTDDDGDGCFDWSGSNRTYCQFGCRDGGCLNGTDQCVTGSSICDGTNVVYCRDVNGDGFNQWDQANVTFCSKECFENITSGVRIAFCEYGSGDFTVWYGTNSAFKDIAAFTDIIFYTPRLKAMFVFVLAMILSLFAAVFTRSWQITVSTFFVIILAATFAGWMPIYITVLFIVLMGALVYVRR